jgi:hypothetical protein
VCCDLVGVKAFCACDLDLVYAVYICKTWLICVNKPEQEDSFCLAVLCVGPSPKVAYIINFNFKPTLREIMRRFYGRWIGYANVLYCC